MTFTIKRSKWLRGTGEGLLLRKDGKQCCIGQCASQAGVPDHQLLRVATLDHAERSVRDALPDLMESGNYEKDWVDKAYGINDDATISDPDRESKLSALAAANGHEFVFVD